MKKNITTIKSKYGCYIAMTTGLLLASYLSVACSSNVDVPDMDVSYGPEIGIADGDVDLTGEEPIINIADIKAEVGMNIDYLSRVTIANEGDFPDLEIWVDASLVDIFTPGHYTAVYTFVYDEKSVSKEVTVTIEESEQSASDVVNSTVGNNNNSNNNNSGQNNTSQIATSEQSTTKDQTTKHPSTTPSQTATTKPPATTTPSQTTKPPVQTTPSQTTTTKPPATTTPTQTTTKKPSNDTDNTTTKREIITTSGNKTTELKNIGNYTIELLSGKNITIRNTTSKYIVSTRTDVSYKDKNGYTYKVSQLIITYNTGAEQVLETVEERVNN